MVKTKTRQLVVFRVPQAGKVNQVRQPVLANSIRHRSARMQILIGRNLAILWALDN